MEMQLDVEQNSCHPIKAGPRASTKLSQLIGWKTKKNNPNFQSLEFSAGRNFSSETSNQLFLFWFVCVLALLLLYDVTNTASFDNIRVRTPSARFFLLLFVFLFTVCLVLKGPGAKSIVSIIFTIKICAEIRVGGQRNR